MTFQEKAFGSKSLIVVEAIELLESAGFQVIEVEGNAEKYHLEIECEDGVKRVLSSVGTNVLKAMALAVDLGIHLTD